MIGAGEKGNNVDGPNPLVDDLPEGKDPFDDDLLLKIFKNCKNSGKSKRQKMARDWFRAELFYNGVQWIRYDEKLRRWREAALKKTTPQPVTNTYASYADVMASLVAATPLEVTYRPINSDSEISQLKVNVANDLVDAMQQITHFREKQREAAAPFIRQGEVFLIPQLVLPEISYDQNEEDQRKADSFADLVAGSLNKDNPANQPGNKPESLAGAMEASPERNPHGLPEGAGNVVKQLLESDPGREKAPPPDAPARPGIPKLVIQVATAFGSYMDEDASDIADSPFFIYEKDYDTALLQMTFPDKAKEIRPAAKLSGDISRYFAGSVSRLTSGEFGSGGYFIVNDGAKNRRSNTSVLWHDPTKNYAKGIYAVIVNDNIVVHKGSLQYHDESGRYFKNIVHLRCKRRIGGIHGRTPLDDAIPKQIQRNKLESFLELIIYRMAAPHWLLPNGCGIDNFTGEPGGKYVYNRVPAGNNGVLKPEMIAGLPPNPVILEWLKKIDEDTEYLLGITKVLLGQLPPDTPAARALELLLDRARARHGDVFMEWNTKWAECMNMLVRIVKQTKPVDIFKATQRAYGGFAIRKFQENDLDMNLEILPETEQSAPPRSTVGELQLLKEFADTGLLMQAPPNILYALCDKFGFDYLIKSLKSDKDYISRENYMLYEGHLPVVRDTDNHTLHHEDHRIFVQTDEYMEWAANPDNAQLAMGMEQHMKEHEMAIAQQAQQAQAAQTDQAVTANMKKEVFKKSLTTAASAAAEQQPSAGIGGMNAGG